MKPYIGIVHKDPESAYGITFPDAPGCFSAADEIDDLFAMAREALAGWIELTLEDGEVPPRTRDLSEVLADPEWAGSLSDAVLFIAVEMPAPGVQKAA